MAGSFYPGQSDTLCATVQQYLDQAQPPDLPVPKAIIVPHAGYIYSAPVAATAYRLIEPARDIITCVVMIGPSHKASVAGLAACEQMGYETPLGVALIDGEAMARAQELPFVQLNEAAHRYEHSLEVQLPFLQVILKEFSIVPLLVGGTSKEQVAETLDVLWGGEETLILISSDLSHYHDYQTALSMDQSTTRAIEELAPDRIEYEDACGRTPIIGLLEAARRRNLKVTTVDMRSSGDTAGPRDQVVGYGAYVFH